MTLADIERLVREGKIRGYFDKRGTAKPKKSKYRNTSTMVDGIKFDSKKEAKRYKELVILQKAGMIGQLRLQVPYELIAKNGNNRACTYRADFVYMLTETGETIVEDCKGMATPEFKLKKKLMKSVHNIDIKIT